MKRFDELTLADRFIFFKVMQNSELCKRLLEIILGVEIERIEYIEGEKTVEAGRDAKGIRFDVYVKDGTGTVYNIEMQAVYAAYLPKRSRYYHSMMNLELLGRGRSIQS